MNKQQADQVLITYLPKLYGFAAGKAFSDAEAEEICAQIVKELYESLLRSPGIQNMDGYVWRISEHVYSKYVSSVKRHRGISLDAVFLSQEDVYDLGEEAGELLRLRREIAFLTKTRRDIVYAYYYENRSIAAITAQTHLPAGTVKWHLNKARHDLKEGLSLDRPIGTLGLHPIRAVRIGHSGTPGTNGGPEFYLNDSLSLNIVYSVYHTSRTKEEIAGELGVTPVFLEEKLELLEQNGFLVRQAQDKFTTFVRFFPQTYSLEQQEHKWKKQLAIAQRLVRDYVPLVRAAVADVTDVYIPGGNRELLEAAAVFYGVANCCRLELKRDLSPYVIKTTDGGSYIVLVEPECTRSDPEYIPALHLPSLVACGNMTRSSEKYPVFSWSIDSRLSSREGYWQNNWTCDYEYLYEFMTGAITDCPASAEKFGRLRSRRFLSEDGQVNVMVVRGPSEAFFERIPKLSETILRAFADDALECAKLEARDYPSQLQDLVISWSAGEFVGNTVALMVMDILYGNGTFRPLNDREKITSNLLVFSDVLPA